MMVTMSLDFREKLLPKDFCREKLHEAEVLIRSGVSFTFLGMPGVGGSFFLRFLATTDLAKFVFVDTYSLAHLNKIEYLRLFLKELGVSSSETAEEKLFATIQSELRKLCEKNKKVVVIFNRFDQIKDELDRSFLSQIRGIRYLFREQLVFIFTSNHPLDIIKPDAVGGGNLSFFSKQFYFGTYSEKDLLSLLEISPIKPLTQIEPVKSSFSKILKWSGGHNQLLHILLKSESLENPLLDRFVKLQLGELYDFLTIRQKKNISHIASGKNISEIDTYLIKIGLVKKIADQYLLFSPLFKEFLLMSAPLKLPVKENKLFKLLEKYLGQVISKEEIFDYVWGDGSLVASDWALNSLVYRLRKNPGFKGSGYSIESFKKEGYVLFKD